MAFDGPQTTDYTNVVSLNRAYLSLLQRDLRARHGLRQLSSRLSDKITGLNKRQIERLAATPFLLLSFREGNDHYWSEVLGGPPGGDLFKSSGSEDLDTLVSAGLGFIWQLARQNPYALRLICGASLHWCEEIAEQTFFRLLVSVAAHGNILQLRAAHDHELWRKLLDDGTNRVKIIRRAAHVSALQAVLTQPQHKKRQAWSLGARRMNSPGLRVADESDD
ncbi:MAG: hypothetical protein DRQ63_12950 [Gammaproteobacteria bacterium]|nr:MAG: hypothetical protein DRQ63_12950 [Gammaproteobacteria bacterium]